MTDWLDLPFDEPPAHQAARPLTVSELTVALRTLVEQAFSVVTVEGEISNCRQWSSGHLYFTLKDEQAQLRAVMFRTAVRTLKFRPEDGMRIVARGRLSLYEAKGEYQIICDGLEPHGLGARQAAFEQVKRRLQSEGLFDAARKRALPVLPRRIGVITSLDGAAVRDIVRVLTTRYPAARVVVRAARVQGDGAAEDLIRALRAIVRVPELDVVIIGRGGGSTEDLWAFNDEGLARAMAACPVPIVSAVGHEVDFTIADFVADVRAATPSNAAEIVVDRADNFCARIDRAEHRLRGVMALGLGRRAHRAAAVAQRLDRWPSSVVMRDRDCRQLGLRLGHALRQQLGRTATRINGLQTRLARQDAHRLVSALRTRLVSATGSLRECVNGRRLAAIGRTAALSGRLDALSPLAVLGRGYAVCWNEDRTSIIRSSERARPGDRVHVTLAEGEIDCRVEGTRDQVRRP